MSNSRLRLILHYANGEKGELKIVCPEEIARHIEQKGLKFVTVFIDKFIQIPVNLDLTKNVEIDKFKMLGG